MTDQERAMIAACGKFYHVTLIDKHDLIQAGGLDPRFDESLIIRGPQRPKAVYLCPPGGLETALDFLGSRNPDQERLLVYRLDSEAVSKRNCGPDYGVVSF
jgi:hypothetical protein